LKQLTTGVKGGVRRGSDSETPRNLNYTILIQKLKIASY
jgi:hypothetical protein